MKHFHISDVLTITTGRLVSTRHMEGVYEILNYMTGDNLFTHQLPRAGKECAPVLCALYPELSTEALADQLAEMDRRIAGAEQTREAIAVVINGWIKEAVLDRLGSGLPLAGEHLPVPTLKDGQARAHQGWAMNIGIRLTLAGFVLATVAAFLLLLALPARGQDVPQPCFPCTEPEQPTCQGCHN